MKGILSPLTYTLDMRQNPNFKKNLDKLANRTVNQAADLERIEKEAIANFSGPLDQLNSAIGMLRMGHHFGWRALYIIHSKRTIRKYEDILNIQIRDLFPEEGPSSFRSIGYEVAKTLKNFWKAVSGDEKIEHRREIKE
ncbi:hypothetical protein ACFL3A_03520 [Pseudomonadota bacterium]